MARNESAMIRRWVDYYGRELGLDNITVLDDNTTDGSTDALPCAVHRLPEHPWRTESWGRARRQMVNGLARSLLVVYDAVLFTDVDEFLVPDPARYDGLVDYVARNQDRPVMAGLGLNLLHAPDVEEPLSPGRPVLSQRSFVKFAPVMCKPAIKRVSAPWLPGFHGIRLPYQIDRDLWLLHLKYHDVDAMRVVAADRHELNVRFDRGDQASAWTLTADDLTRRHLRWVAGADPVRTPEFDSAEPDLTGVVCNARGRFHRSTGTQLGAMDRNPLRRLPARVREVL